MAGVDIKNLSKTYFVGDNQVSALSKINLAIKEGEFLSIVGRSGSGKTTLLRIISGLENSSSGEITFISKDEKQKKAKVGIVFQEPRLMPWLTVEENMAFAFEKYGTQEKEIVNSYLELLGLGKFREAYPEQISGGMAQRVALGRTLCYDPDLILMDEPLGALDAFTRRKLQEELINIYLSQKKTIIFVTHDVDEAVFLGQRVLVMEGGRIIKEVKVNLNYLRDTLAREFFLLRENVLKTITGKGM